MSGTAIAERRQNCGGLATPRSSRTAPLCAKTNTAAKKKFAILDALSVQCHAANVKFRDPKDVLIARI
jgi:hypothetical protein